jgi:retron-type reverse transcriptase
MLTWNQLYTLDSLLIAATQNYTKCLFQKYKSYTLDVNNNTLYDWARYNKANLIKLHNQLRDRSFAFQPFNKKIIRLGSKVREIYIPTWRDRIVDGMLNVELNRHTDNLQSRHSYAYRLKNSGVDICQTRIARKLFEYDCPVYVIKRDISNYYPSISKPIMLDKIAKFVDKNDYLFRLMKSRIYYNAMRNGVHCPDSGIPFGSPLSCFLANLYLSDLDFIMEKHSVNYFRYADDILIFGSDRNEVLAAWADLDAELNKLQLTCKPSHTKNVCFYGSGDEIFQKTTSLKHLGLYFKDSKLIGIAREKQRKILNIFKRIIQRRMGGINKLKTPEARARMIIGLINKAITENIKPTAVIDYYLKHMTDVDQIKLIDRLVAELVLAVATNRGHKKSNWKILSFKQLREMGLPSLMHRHSLLNHGHISSNFFDFRIRKKSKVDVKTIKEVSYHDTI